jgi:hypothetical protein
MKMNALIDVCLALDTKNMITKFNQVLMINPEDKKVAGYNQTIRAIRRYEYERDMYPPHVNKIA